MMLYRKKPVVIEAFQLTEEFIGNELNWPQWLINAKQDGRVTILGDDKVHALAISTLEGVMQADRNDFIIRGVRGELYPCKPDIFEDTYVRVDSL
jgi:hypothetical protein